MKVLHLVALVLFLNLRSFAVVLYPTLQAVDAIPGQPTSATIYVTNQVDLSGQATFQITDLSASPRFLYIYSRPIPGSPASWIDSSTGTIDLAGKTTTEYKMAIKVPVGTKPGEYWIAFTIDPNETGKFQQKTFQVNLKTVLVAFLTINVSPGLQVPKNAKLVEPQVVMPEKPDQPVKVKVSFQNLGQSSVRASGQVRILGANGRVFDKFNLYNTSDTLKGKAFIFPNGLRDFEGVIQQRLPPGKYVAEFTFDYGNGWRTATAKQVFEITQEISAGQEKLLKLITDIDLFGFTIPKGGTRIGKIHMTNQSFDPQEVTISMEKLVGVTVEPAKCVLAPGGQQDFRIIAKMPKDGEAVQFEQAGTIVFQPKEGQPVRVSLRTSLPQQNSEVKEKSDEK